MVLINTSVYTLFTFSRSRKGLLKVIEAEKKILTGEYLEWRRDGPVIPASNKKLNGPRKRSFL